MAKFRIHPLFVVLAIVSIWLYGFLPFISTIMAVILHELAHMLMACERGYITNKITLLPYGAVLNNEDNLDNMSLLLIALAGPVANFLLAIITVSFWWLIPASYAVTEFFVKANLTIGIFNLIPVFPLDGARIVLALCNNTAKTLKVLKVCGIVFSMTLFAFFLLTAFFKINLTIGILAIFLYIGAVSGTNREMYAHIHKCSPFAKSYEHGVKHQVLYVSADIQLARILKMINTKSITTFVVMNDNKKIAVLNEETIMKIITKNKLNDTLLNALKSEPVFNILL